ncbi:hypothetical protein [Parapedobacter sp.]
MAALKISGNNFKIYLNDKAGLTDDELGLLPYVPKSKHIKKGQPLVAEGQICRDYKKDDESGNYSIINF